jgi:hypothetical protein
MIESSGIPSPIAMPTTLIDAIAATIDRHRMWVAIVDMDGCALSFIENGGIRSREAVIDLMQIRLPVP